MEIVGRELEAGYSTESSRGTAETTVNKWQKSVSVSIVERAENVVDDATHGSLEDSDQRRITQKWVEGDLEGIVHADALGYLLSSIYGGVDTTTVAGDVRSHNFKLKQSIQHQSLTVFAKDGGVQNLAFAGCAVSTLELNASVDDFVRFTASFIGQTAADDTETPSYDTEYDFIGRDITVKMASSEAGLSGATAIKLKSVDVTFDQGAIRDHVFGAYTADDVYNSKMMIEGSFTINFADEVYKDLYLGDTAQYMEIAIVGAADIGGGSNPAITLLLNKVQIMDWNRSGDNDSLVEGEVSFKAFYNAADSQQSELTLVNLTDTYPNTPSN
jgi:hypothetical protein